MLSDKVKEWSGVGIVLFCGAALILTLAAEVGRKVLDDWQVEVWVARGVLVLLLLFGITLTYSGERRKTEHKGG